jgi:peptidyl-prolyl cis-trans isomerase D
MKEYCKKFLLLMLAAVFVLTSVSGILFLTDRFDIVTTKKDDIHVNEFVKYLEREKQTTLEAFLKKNIENKTKETFDRKIFESRDFLELSLHKLLNFKLLYFETERYGIKQKKEIVISKIFKEPTLLTNDKFDSLKYRQYLDKIGIEEEDFLDLLAKDDEAAFLISLFTSVSQVDDIMAIKMFVKANTQREITLFSKKKNKFVIKEKMYSDEEIMDFYNNNGQMFEIPESRKIDYLEFDDLTGRDLIFELLLTANDIEDLAKKTNKKVQTFGFVGSDDIFRENKHSLQKVFSQSKDELSDLEVVGDKLYVYAVTDIKEKHRSSVEEVREEINKKLNEAERESLVIKNAMDVLENYKNSNKKQAVLNRNGFASKNTKVLMRSDTKYDKDFITDVFEKQKGEMTNIFASEDEVYFAIVGDIKTLSKEDSDFMPIETITRKMSNSTLRSIQNDYIYYLKDVRYKVKVNNKLLKLLLPKP